MTRSIRNLTLSILIVLTTGNILPLLIPDYFTVSAQSTTDIVDSEAKSKEVLEDEEDPRFPHLDRTTLLPLLPYGRESSSNMSNWIQAAGKITPRTEKPNSWPGNDIYEGKDELTAEFDSGHVRSIRCEIVDPKSHSEFRALQESVMLNFDPATIYPGSLIQGRYLDTTAEYIPITIPRGSGRIFVDGITLSSGTQVSKDIDEISAANVRQATHEILSQGVTGTASRIYYDLSEIHSEEDLAFELGIDARYLGASVKGQFNYNTESARSYTALKFVQVFYDVVFELPERPADVFRDGALAQDEFNQISQFNPPVYVQRVSFGRVILFLAESKFDSESVAASLRASYSGLVGGVDVRSSLSYEEILNETKISYIVIGGNAGTSVQPINTDDARSMFQAVKAFIGDAKSAVYAPDNPGAAVAVTMRYLHDNSPAKVTFFGADKSRNCKTDLRNTSIQFVGPSGGVGGNTFPYTLPDGKPLESIEIGFGTLGGHRWYEDKNKDVKVIRYLKIKHQGDEPLMYGKKEGEIEGTEPYSLTLTTNEKIVGLTGYHDGFTVIGLKIHTNFRDTPLIGSQQGLRFSYTAPHNTEIVSFWGREGSAIDAIGPVVRSSLEPIDNNAVWHFGPVGGGTGTDDLPTPKTQEYRTERLNADQFIETIQIRLVVTPTEHSGFEPIAGIKIDDQEWIGGEQNTYDEVESFQLRETCPESNDAEYLTEVSGTYEPVGGIHGKRYVPQWPFYKIEVLESYRSWYIASLEFHTNCGEVYSYGKPGRTSFSMKAPDGYAITGFLGQTGKSLAYDKSRELSLDEQRDQNTPLNDEENAARIAFLNEIQGLPTVIKALGIVMNKAPF